MEYDEEGEEEYDQEGEEEEEEPEDGTPWYLVNGEANALLGL